MEDDCNNKCRACLSENDAMLSLFEVYEHDLTLAMILKSCISNIEVSEDDGLPSYLCDSCILVVTQFYNFTVVFEESDRYLKSLCSKDIKSVTFNSPSKVEPSVLKEEYGNETKENQEASEDNLLIDDNLDEVPCEDTKNIMRELNYAESKDQSDEPDDVKGDDNAGAHDEEDVPTVVPIYEEVIKYECTLCGEAHLYASAFQQHMRSKHRMADVDCKPYSSKIQIKVFESLHKKKKELEVKPTAPASYSCKYCHKKYSYEGQLQQHLKLHEGKKKYVCEICGSCFIRKTYLDDHKEGHSTEKKHVCKFCGKAFRRRTVLRAHKRTHTHPNHYVCEICGRAFTNNSTLKTHKLLIHIKERNFLCVICNLKFPLKSTLNKHILRHQKRENGEKGFNCMHCPMQYRDKSSLKRHVEAKHQGTIDLIPCYDCPKRYTSKANLMKHIRRHHNTSMVVAEEVVL